MKEGRELRNHFAALLAAAALLSPASVCGAELQVFDKFAVRGNALYPGVNISSAAGYAGDLLGISTGAAAVIRLTGGGGVYATKFYGDASGLTYPPVLDSLGNHVATTSLQMGAYNLVFSDVELARAAADVLGLPAGDSLNLAAGALQIGGTEVVSSGGLLLAAAGTAAAPAFGFTGYPGTGLYSGGAYGLDMAVGGAGHSWLTADGMMGIGTASPGYRVHISSTAGSGGILLAVSTGSSNVITMKGNGDVTALKFAGDGSAFWTGTSNNLGNHIATTTLNMNGFSILSGSSITATGAISAASFRDDAVPNKDFISLRSGVNNLAIGDDAGLSVTTGGGNLFIGQDAGQSTTTGSSNTLVGFQTGNPVTGVGNTCVGHQNGCVYGGDISSNTCLGFRTPWNAGTELRVGTWLGANGGGAAGPDNVILGQGAGLALQNNNVKNTQLGSQGLYYMRGSENTGIGYNAAWGASNPSYTSSSTYIGAYSGSGVSNAEGNVLIGYSAGSSITTGSKNIVIGVNQQVKPSGTASNYINIYGIINGYTADGGQAIGISTGSPVATLDVNGSLGLYSQTFAQLQATVPTAVGQTYYCSTCSPPKAVVSTGTSAGNFASFSGGTFR